MLFTRKDALWDLVGIGVSVDGVTDAAENHDEYLADAYTDLHDQRPPDDTGSEQSSWTPPPSR